jgi:uncharacterized protein (TIGR03437 family)
LWKQVCFYQQRERKLTMMNFRNHRSITAWALVAGLITTSSGALAQSRVAVPKNNYTPAQDVQIGRQAAAEVEREFPMLRESSSVDSYVERVGQRLVAAIPPQYRHPQFRYSFDVVNASDINAFALPGGPMYVNRGMIQAARTEGEMAGVMAHEIAHVALRHGTAQATKAQSAKFQLPALGGAILGAIIGGSLGNIVAQGTQFGLGVYFLRYSRDYERQADGTAEGAATVTVTSGSGRSSTGTVQIRAAVPGLFSANASGQGVAAALAVRVKANGALIYEAVAQWDAAQGRFGPLPIDLGPDQGAATDVIVLALFGTGIRYRQSVSVNIGGVAVPVDYAGITPGFIGLDQVNVRLSRSLIGRGEAPVNLIVDGRTANQVTVAVK